MVIARRAGLSEAEIARIKADAEAEGWSEAEGALIRVADELIADKMLSEEAWAGLAAHYSTEQVLDVIFTVGNYTAVAMAVNAIGVQLDEGLERF